MQYKGFSITVSWNEKNLGYDYKVRDAECRIVAESAESYFYMENAEKAAKEFIDNLKTE